MLRRLSHPRFRIVAVSLVVLTTLASVVAPDERTPRALAQDATPTIPPAPTATSSSDNVAAIMARMSLQQRVGQLFVVSFPSTVTLAITNTATSSEIADLITNFRIGGVQLRAANRNFDNALVDPPVMQQVAQLANRLQSLAVVTSTGPSAGEVFVASPTKIAVTDSPTVTVTPTPTVAPNAPSPSIPLFIAMSQDADTTGRAERGEITQGLTPLPSQMAIGATWNPANAQAVGEILGGELSRLGVNVLFGPTLDVVDAPKPNTPGDFGTQVFGGDKFWVGKLGGAFVTGVHRGSKNRMAVIAKNFPGLGASDRDERQEIPTVQKSIDQLKQIELAPFFAIMRSDPARDPVKEHTDSVTDGVMVSHIRYRGFQGVIRANTRPVSFDPQAYQALMALPEIQPWRAAGGLTFSDSLGARSVRRFYDPLEASFNARRIAQEAFVAGNDVLVLGDFGLSNNWDEQLANIKDVIRFFQSKYQEDPNFAARVDESVARILTLKLRLFGGRFDQQNTLVDEQTAALLTPQTNVVAGIAKESMTLLSPNPRDPASAQPTQPTKDESIVFITDDRTLQDCAQCAPYAAVPRTALQDLALNLYGPRTTGQVDPARVSSFTFSDLAAYNVQVSAQATGTITATTVVTKVAVAAATPKPTRTPASATAVTSQPATLQDIGMAISRTQWIVITLIDANPAISSTAALRTFLSQSADTLRDKHVIVFTLGAPYYLDATEISKITAYYGVYSRAPAFLEGAIRVLFGEFAPKGAAPVDVAGLNYALAVQTAPNPAQVIPLGYGNAITGTQTTPTPLELKIGDQLKLRAGPVLDLNGYVVPDGTPVLFVVSYPNERVEQRLGPVTTRDGVAETTIPLERKGKINIRVEAGPALNSLTVAVNIADTVSIETIKPTPVPTNPPQPTATVVNTQPVTSTVVVGTPPGATSLGQMRASLPGFVLTFIGLLLIGLGAFGVLTVEKIESLKVSSRLRIVLSLWMLGWLAYALVAIGLPGTRWLTNSLGWGGSVLAAIIISLVGAGIVIATARFSLRSLDE